MKLLARICFILFIGLNICFACFAQNAISTKAMVVSEHYLASEVGISILNQGGNAFDAAVSVAYALAVVNPCCGNIGGGGFATLHLQNGKNTVLNFRERAPYTSNKKTFTRYNPNSLTSTHGYLAVAVPGTVLGLETLLTKYGTLPRNVVMQPAIALAEKGFIVTPYLAKQFKTYRSILTSQQNIKQIFLVHGETPKAGERLVQKELANTLKLIAQHGPAVFYSGSIAKELVKASQKNHGLLSMHDFESYRVKESAPIICDYRGYTFISAPPPSAGGTVLCEMLNILQHFNLKEYSYESSKAKRILIESMRYGFNDRNKLGDPDFVNNPINTLLSTAYAEQLSDRIKQSHFSPPKQPSRKIPTLSDTTHFSIIDKHGNAIALTYTLNGFFGAKVIAGDTGFFLNNEMDDFTTVLGASNKFGLVQSDNNQIEPGKRPLSSMTPTIMVKDNQVVLVLGSPGGPRIISSILLTLINFLDYGMDLKDAINAPRFHFQGSPNYVFTEPFAFSPLTQKQLELMDYHLFPEGTWSAIEAIYVDSHHDLYGVNDKRRPDGAAIGS